MVFFSPTFKTVFKPSSLFLFLQTHLVFFRISTYYTCGTHTPSVCLQSCPYSSSKYVLSPYIPIYIMWFCLYVVFMWFNIFHVSYPELFVLSYPIINVEIIQKYYTVSYVFCGRRGSAYFRAILVQISAPFWRRFPRHFGADFCAILVQISAPFWLIFLNPHQRFFPQNITQKNFAPPESFLQIHTYPTLFRFTFYPNTNFSLNLIQYF